MTDIAALRAAVIAAEKAGHADEARRLFDAALARNALNPELFNNAAGSALRMGDVIRAVALYRRAHELAPANVEFALNLAIALGKAEYHRQAVVLLQGYEAAGGGNGRYWSVRAASERDAGMLCAAALSYDRCLQLEPRQPRAMHGRARVALERGEAEALARYEQALAVNPGDAMVWLGRAQALEASGDFGQAREIAASLSGQMPQWLDAHRYLAELRLNMGEGEDGSTAFADHYASAVEKLPANSSLVTAWCSTLSGADRFDAADAVARRGLGQHPDNARIRLSAAICASAVGDFDRATALFATMPAGDVEWRIEEARHRLRVNEPQRAESLLSSALSDAPGNVKAWALRSLAWRMLDDPREDWLHGQAGLVRMMPLEIGTSDLEAAIRVLNELHDGSFHPVGQSVKGGTQTRGALFERTEPELAVLRDAIWRTIESFRAQLPAVDAAHPLLCHREADLAITGSWSVRLGSGGRHSVHIHPRGLLSSALYLQLPSVDPVDATGGWLELGGAPPEMGLDLPPRISIEPQQAHLALFPSTLFHGTRPFSQGQRMTVAFDVSKAS